jgi:hypothetical protein
MTESMPEKVDLIFDANADRCDKDEPANRAQNLTDRHKKVQGQIRALGFRHNG